MKKLLKKYNITQEFIDLIIKIDELTDDEVRDLDYMEDRIQTHLEVLTKLAAIQL
tara:strand:+ start:246 stop:410 length:165 start_codon:yes stop_codon:yes gene_type:complete